MLDETPLAPLEPAGVVFMASGQGSQKPGMGADMLDIPEVANVFACASDVLGRDVAALVRDASPEELNDTRNAQIAIAALSVGMGRALEARGIVPDALLGFSLGQVSAMVLGGMLAEEDAFALIAERSRLMGEAADANPGVMSALLKITLPEAEALMLATAAMGSVSAMNGLGRLINGFIWDKFGYRVCLTWIAVAFAAGMLCCAFAMMGSNFPLLVAGFMLLGLMYGGNMCSMSAMVGTFFGPKYYGINYAIATCQMIPAAIVGPQILALSQMGSGSYLGAFWVFFGVAIAALIVSLFIKPPKNNRAA